MAFSIINTTGDGVTDTFSINFALGFLSRGDVTCRVGNEVDGLGNPVYRTLTWLTDGLVKINGAIVGFGVPVVFKRTVSKTTLVHDYAKGAQIAEKNLDESNKQMLMAIHEFLDGRIETPLANNLNLGTNKVINMLPGTNATDGVNLAQLQDYTGNAPTYALQALGYRNDAQIARTDAQTARTDSIQAKTDAQAAQAAAEALLAGQKWRPSVRMASTGNLTLSGVQTIDGVSGAVGNRVLVKDQTLAAQNGVYLMAAGTWTRATDANSWTQLVSQVVAVEEGTTQADKIYIATVNAGGTINTTPVTWTSITSGVGNINVFRLVAGVNFNPGDNSVTVPAGALAVFAMDGLLQNSADYTNNPSTGVVSLTSPVPAGVTQISGVILSLLPIGTPSNNTVDRTKLTVDGLFDIQVNSTGAATIGALGDYYNLSASGGAFTQPLPVASSNLGRIIRFRKSDTTLNIITLGSVTTLNTQFESVELECDGTNWFVIDRTIISEWVAYVATVTGYGTPTATAFLSRRNGDSLEVMGRFTSSAVTAVEARVTLGYAGVDQPTGLTVDTTKVPALLLVGNATTSYSGSYVSYGVVVDNSGSNFVCFTMQGSGAISKQLANSTMNAGQAMAFRALVPITGWKG